MLRNEQRVKGFPSETKSGLNQSLNYGQFFSNLFVLQRRMVNASRDSLSRNTYAITFLCSLLDLVFSGNPYVVDVLWDQQIKLIQVCSTSEFHEY